MSKPYVRPVDCCWWAKRPAYRLFMLRELSGCFIAFFVLELLCIVSAVNRGPEALATFFEALRSPGWIALHWVTLAFALLHSITWFNLTPKVLVFRIGEDKIPGFLIAAGHYGAWLVTSLILVCIVL